MTIPDKDVLGNALSADERELLEIYQRTVTLSEREDLPPVAAANVKQAMVLLWNACNDLALTTEQPNCD